MSSTSTKPIHGGRREGAGRPAGKGPHGEATEPVRIPKSLVPLVRDWLDQRHAANDDLPRSPDMYRPAFTPDTPTLPLFGSRISAGFPSPADDYVEDMLDLQQLLVEHPAATFYLRVSGDSMIEAGILNGDILVVDRSVEPKHDLIVVASIDSELTVKRLYRKRRRVALVPENPIYRPIEVNDDMDVQIWGVVTGVVRKF